MAGKKLELGPIGEVVSRNVARYRAVAKLTRTELSNELGKQGRDIPPLGIRRIEEGNRRVDVDDLVALALALNVSPLTLLLPRQDSALSPGGEVFAAQKIWRWAEGSRPLTGDPLQTVAAVAFLLNSNPFGDLVALGFPEEMAEKLQAVLHLISVSPAQVDWDPDNLSLEIRAFTGDAHGND